MNFEEILTDRLILRKISDETYDEIFKTYTDEEIKDLLGIDTEEALIKEKAKYQGGIASHNKKILYFQLLDKETKKIIGWCGFHTWYIDHFRAEIGYGLFDEHYKRKGLMSEAIFPIINYGFEQMNLHRIEAFISPYNDASLKLIKKLNFKEEGLLREHYYTNNKSEDSMVFGLLKHEFE